jgi:DNA-binding CsgD family transcriptional regulator
VGLEPLSEAAVARGLRESVLPGAEPAFARACHEATRGNPLLLAELAVELAMREVAPEDKNAELVQELAPESLAHNVLVRLRRLGDGAVELARAVAVLGDGAELRHAAPLADLPVERAIQLADALMGAGVLRREPGLSFVHPVVRVSMDADRPEFERAEAHRRAAGMLMNEGASMERVAPHLLAGRPDNDPRAVEVLLEAGTRALAGGAPESAVRLLRRALDEPPPQERRADVLVALGRAEGAAGDPSAIERLTDALELLGEPTGRAAAALDAGRLLLNHARWDDAAHTLERGIADVDGTDDSLRASLEAAYVMAARLVPADADLPPAAVEDAALESTVAGRLILARTAAARALRGTSAAEVHRLATRALGGGALLEDETSDGIGFYLAVFALTVAEDLQTAELAAATAVDDAQRRGSVLAFATACHFRSLAVLRRGRIQDAAADNVNALAARDFGWRRSLGAAVSVQAECLLERGELDEAARELQTLMDEKGTAGGDPRDFRFVGVRGHVRLLQLSPATALEDLLEAGRLMKEVSGDHPAIYPWRSLASAACLALGDRAEARRLAEEELALAAAFGAPGAHGRAIGALAATADGAEALELRQEAVRVLESSQAALDRARALIDFGATLRRATRRRDAREPLKLGLDLAGRCGARALAQRAREELVAVGARPRRDAATGREALTVRESQVAGLAAQGMSNREIAEALFVTVKTVEWHLKHAYRKLGVSSRRELGAALLSD